MWRELRQGNDGQWKLGGRVVVMVTTWTGGNWSRGWGGGGGGRSEGERKGRGERGKGGARPVCTQTTTVQRHLSTLTVVSQNSGQHTINRNSIMSNSHSMRLSKFSYYICSFSALYGL